MKFTLFIIFHFAAFNFVFAQTSDYKIKAKNRQIVVVNRGKSHVLNLSDKIDAAKITDSEILFASRKNGFIYLALDISGQSKMKSDDRQCGAGIEFYLGKTRFKLENSRFKFRPL